MDSTAKWRLVRIVITTVYMFGGWLLFSGTIHPRSLVLGLIASAAVAMGTYHLFFDSNEAGRRILFPRPDVFALFILVIIYKMYVASFRVLYLLARQRINPRVVHFRTRLKSDLARMMLSNAITMTPGTITLNLDDDHLIVHWLDAKTTHSRYAGEQIKGRFEQLLHRVWG